MPFAFFLLVFCDGDADLVFDLTLVSKATRCSDPLVAGGAVVVDVGVFACK